MLRNPTRARRLAGFLLVMLTLVPVAVSAHRYVHAPGDHAACAVCVVVAHGAVSIAAPVAVAGISPLVVALVPSSGPALATRPAPLRCGRAPPSAPVLLVG